MTSLDETISAVTKFFAEEWARVAGNVSEDVGGYGNRAHLPMLYKIISKKESA